MGFRRLMWSFSERAEDRDGRGRPLWEERAAFIFECVGVTYRRDYIALRARIAAVIVPSSR